MNVDDSAEHEASGAALAPPVRNHLLDVKHRRDDAARLFRDDLLNVKNRRANAAPLACSSDLKGI